MGRNCVCWRVPKRLPTTPLVLANAETCARATNRNNWRSAVCAHAISLCGVCVFARQGLAVWHALLLSLLKAVAGHGRLVVAKLTECKGNKNRRGYCPMRLLRATAADLNHAALIGAGLAATAEGCGSFALGSGPFAHGGRGRLLESDEAVMSQARECRPVLSSSRGLLRIHSGQHT